MRRLRADVIFRENVERSILDGFDAKMNMIKELTDIFIPSKLECRRYFFNNFSLSRYKK